MPTPIRRQPELAPTPRPKMGPSQRARVAIAAALLLAVLAAHPAPSAHARLQFFRPDVDPTTSINPVFIDSSPVIADALTRADDHLASGNLDEAARVLQRLLDEHGHELSLTPTPNLFEPLRARVHRTLQSSPALLDRYRQRQEALARQALTPNPTASPTPAALDDVIRTRLLTDAGFDAALSTARRLYLGAHFDSAVLVLAELQRHPALTPVLTPVLTPATQDAPRRAAALRQLTLDLAPRVSDHTTRQLLTDLHSTLAPPNAPAPPNVPVAPAPPDPAAVPGLPRFIAPPPIAIEPPALLEPAATLPPEALVARPIGSGEINDHLPATPADGGTRQDIEKFPPWGVLLRSWPALSDHGVFIQDSTRLLGFDRLTARPRWTIDAADLLAWPATDASRSAQPSLGRRTILATEREDAFGPAVIGQLVVAALSAEGQVRLDSPEAVVAVDQLTGHVRWLKPLVQLDPQLFRASQRGPVLQGAGLAVFSMVRNLPERRLRAAVIAAIDPETGQLAWVRTIASSGALPYLANERVADGATLRAGVIYRSDLLGVVAAYRVSDGLPLWARVIPTAVSSNADPTPDGPWAMNTPAIGPNSLWLLAPDRTSMFELDRRTGAQLATRPTADLSSPQYILAAGSWLALVSQGWVATLPQSGWETAEPLSSGELEPRPVGIRGRVSVAADRLVVPVPRGLLILDPAAPRPPLREILLDAPGTPLATPTGLIVVDDRRVHAYSTWDLASAELKAQAAVGGGRLVPASELLSLAERSARSQDVLPALDLALAGAARAQTQDPDAEGLQAARRRIVELVLTIVERSELDLRTPGARLDAQGVDAAITKLERLANSPQQTASILLTRSQLMLKRGDPIGAIAAAQQVLEDPALAESSWSGPGRAGLSAAGEARARLAQALRVAGRAAYAAFDARADAALAKVPPAGPSDAVESVLRAYPGARVGPDRWLALAQARGADKPAQARALELGLQFAAAIPDPAPETIARLQGELIDNLRQRELIAAALDALDRAQRTWPGVPLLTAAGPIDQAALRAALATEVSAGPRLPNLGPPSPTGALQELTGWALAEPMIRLTSRAGTAFTPMHNAQGAFAIFGLAPGATVAEATTAAPAPVSALWQDPLITSRPDVLLQDPQGCVIFIPTGKGGKLTRAQADGSTPWQTKPFGELFPTQPPLQFGQLLESSTVRVALAGLRPVSELVAAADARTIALVERTGRAAAFDAQTGELLWTAKLPLGSVSEAALGSGQLVVTGLADKDLAQRVGLARAPVILTIDARSGALATTTPSPVSDVGWVRVAPGRLIVGGEQGIASIDARSGDIQWRLTAHPAASTREAWLLDTYSAQGPTPQASTQASTQQLLVVLTDDRALWRINPQTGRPDDQPLITRQRLDSPGPVSVTALDQGRIALTSSRGVAIFDDQGKLSGLDATGSEDATIIPQLTQAGAMTIVPAPATVGDIPSPTGGTTAYSIVRLELPSARAVGLTPLRLPNAPLRLVAIDGRLLVTHAHSTTVIPAPASAR